MQTPWGMDILQLLMVVVVFVLAGGVKGVTGMGLPTVAVSLLGLWMSPVQAVALLVIPSLATNIAQCRGPHLRSLVSRLWPGWLAIAIVTVSSPGLGGAVSAQSTQGWLGGILMAYSIWGLWRPHLPDLSLTSKWLSLPIGAATGFVTALTAVLAAGPYFAREFPVGKTTFRTVTALTPALPSLSLHNKVDRPQPLPGCFMEATQ